MFFKALADQTRLRLIHLLGDDELCVCVCVEVLKSHQSKISRHLAYLRRAGLVATRRDGKLTHYRVVKPSEKQAAILAEVREWLAGIPQMQKDRERLHEICAATLTKRPANAALQSRDARQTAAATR